ncbi:MAG: DUF429 domain-containing protein [Burkholderiales bacterium]|nr:DUF429 domain-containing protein [Burkholderiales bacterium]
MVPGGRHAGVTRPARPPTRRACHDRPMLIGVDFSSAPTRRKPIVVAQGQLRGAVLQLQRFERFETLAAFGAWLQATPAWTGGFDLPFGLPRELVQQLAWPPGWRACITHYAALDRPTIRSTFAGFCAGRPVGSKFAHRVCDGPAGASPSMKWVNPPVAYMLHAGLPLLLAAGAHCPAHEPTPAQAPRVALEAYPGLLAREVIGHRSYKSDTPAKQTPERLIARKDLVEALEQGRTRLGLRLKLGHAQHAALVDDASGDALDAVLCLLQAAWASTRPHWGLPAGIDTLEGWILSA